MGNERLEDVGYWHFLSVTSTVTAALDWLPKGKQFGLQCRGDYAAVPLYLHPDRGW